MASVDELKDIASQVRRDIIRMVNGANSGHPGGSLGCTDYMVALYFEVMKRNPGFSMDGIGEDLFFLSNGHICPVWYSVLAHAGYFEKKELGTFRKLDSRLQGHPATIEHLPGIREASGSLGQGMSVAIGAALSKKLNKDSSLVFSLHGDGEFQEGQIWEALMFAPHHKVDNLISAIDYNNKQIDGDVDQVLSHRNLKAKIIEFGWDLLEITEGNKMEAVLAGLNEAKARTGKGKPVFILMHTHMGYGVDFMLDNHHWHGVAPNAEQTAKALAQLPETLGDY
ncbi:MAG TPA: transketolase [Chitinophagales bacterium]|nr:transketolase [Chitinophagales bacterium]